MFLSKSTALFGALAFAARANAHGFVSEIVAGGNSHDGYLVDKFPYNPDHPDVIGWATSATDLGFVSPDAFSSPDIICHRDSEPGAISASVAAGGTIELQWNTWPESHHGPVIDYLADCNGDCASADKTSLKFFKISEAGLQDGSSAPGTWASDELISNGNSWTVTIPESIAPGNYVLRHEIIALHSAGNENGAQNYPQCLNLEITGGGSDKPEGTLGTELYTASDPGIVFDIYQSTDSYPIPGPKLFNGGSGGSGGDGGSDGSDGSGEDSPNPPAPTATQPAPDVPESSTTFATLTRTQIPAPTGTTPPPVETDGPLPVNLPEDLTRQELLVLAQEIMDRLLALSEQ